MSYGKLRNLVRSLSSSVNTLEQATSAGAPAPGSVILVGATTNTTYDTIAEAIAASVAGDTILLGAGTYNESFTIPAGVIVRGTPAPRDVVLAGSSSTGNIVELNSSCTLREVTFTTPTGPYAAVRYSGSLGGAAAAVLDVVVAGGGSSGTGLRNFGSCRLFCRDINYVSGTVGKLFHNDGNGTTFIQDGNQLSGTIEQVFCVSTGSIIARSWEVLTGSIGTGIVFSGSNTTFQGDQILFNSTNNIGAHIAAESASFHSIGGDINGTTYDVLVDSGIGGVGSNFFAYGTKFRYEQLSFPSAYAANAEIYAVMHDLGVQNDPSFKIITELSVGSPEIPKEAAFGEGDSTTLGMFVFSSSSAGGWVDNTVAAKSSAGSTFNLYGSTASGSTAYFGNSTRVFPGFKVDTVTPITGAQGVWEFWNGTNWQSSIIMSTQANYPYKSYAQESYKKSEPTQVRFCRCTGSWGLTTINGQSGYWIRNRLTGSITTDPSIQRIKLHTNRTEINPDGLIEHFGRAQPVRDLVWHKNMEDDLVGSSPTDSTIAFSTNIDISPIDNTFTANALDGNGGMIEIPPGLNTSFPVTFEIYWYPTANGAPSTVELEMKVSEVKLGDAINGTLPEQSFSSSIAVGTGDANILKKTSFEVETPNVLPGEFLAFSYFRDGQAGNTDDDFGSSIVIVKTAWKGTFWK